MKRIGMLYLGRHGSATVETLELCKKFVLENYIFIILSKQIDNLNEYRKLVDKYPGHVKLFTINTYKNKIGFLFRSLNIFRFIYISFIIRREKLDFIYQEMISYWGAIVSLFLRKQKVITAIHDPEMHIGEKDHLFELLSKKCVQKSYGLVVFSEKFVDVVSRKYSFPKDRICNLKLGGYSYYKTSNNDAILESNKYKFNKILFFGRITQYKGVGLLLEAIKKLNTEGTRIKVKVVGNGSFSSHEKTLIAELGDNVELVNRWIRDDEVEKFFNDIDFTVLPYVEATQSGVIMLSYAMHRAVLVTNVGALREQVLEDTGIIVEPNDVNSLIDGIKRLYENDNYIIKGNKAFYYATQEWTWDKQAQKLLDFFNF